MVKVTLDIPEELDTEINVVKASQRMPNKRDAIIYMLKEYLKGKKPSFWG